MKIKLLSKSKGKTRKFFYGKILLFLIASSIMIGHALRMIYQGVFQPDSYYQPGLFDILFDWTTLGILGFVILYLTLKTFYKEYGNLKKYQAH